MPLSRDSRDERKLKKLLRVQLGYKQFCERVDYEEDVIIPIIEAAKSGKAIPQLGLQAGEAFQIVLDRLPNANPHPPTTGDTGE